MTDFNACAALVNRGDADRFMATMAAPVAARRVLFPLYAFNLEVARAHWVTQEAMIAEMRLQWWRDALEEIRTGATVRRHEVVTPLAELLTPDHAEQLDQLVEARRWDIAKEAFEDEVSFDTYIDQTSGNLLWVAASLLGTADEDVVRQAAFAHGVARWFQAIPALEAQDRIPLVDGRPEAISDLADRALNVLSEARRERRSVDKAAGAALLSVWQSDAILRQARANPQRVADGTLGISEFRRKSTLVARSLTGWW
jgi:phytoene/squalene synthetase